MNATERRASEPRLYADSSALVKVIVREPESEDLLAYLGDPAPRLVTSRLAVVEVSRAARIARPQADVHAEVARVLERCDLLDVTRRIVGHAASLASEALRALDAIHLATIVQVEPHAVLAYDRRLVQGARGLGFAVVHPGAEL